MPRRHFLRPAQTLSLLALTGATVVSCSSDFDTTRDTSSPKTTLGEDMYSTLCDRVGASALPEDLEGVSYHSVCHKSDSGWKVTTVDQGALPPVDAASKTGNLRKLSVAKVEAMARHREDLIQAFDSIFPDDSLFDPFHPTDTTKKIRLHDALTILTQRLTPLYESSPYGASDPALLPSTTESLARFFDAFVQSSSAQTSLAKMGSRQGYRPLSVSLGAIRAFLAYPRLRELMKVLLDRTAPGGSMADVFQHFLAVTQHELTALAPDPDVGPVIVNNATIQPNRPRQKLEILSSLFLAQDVVYNRTNAAAHPIALRDGRGYVIPQGWIPGSPTGFKVDNDGYLAHDALGMFLDASGASLATSPPFLTPDLAAPPGVTFDAMSGQAKQGEDLLYEYLDTSQTFAGSMLHDFQPLVAASTGYESTLMQALEGAYVLYGNKITGDSTYPIPYQAFDPESSPLLDLTHATGQLLGAQNSDDLLGAILDLHQNHPDKTGRALALSWSMWNQGKDPAYAAAVLADTSTFWDDMADWIAKISRVGKDHYTGGASTPNPLGFIPDLTLAMGDPAAQKWLPLAYAPAMHAKDRITYDPSNMNGPPFDLDTNTALTAMGGPTTPVDRTASDTGDNRSAFQRFAHVIAAAAKVKGCNKSGTLVKSDLNICGLLNLPLTYPINLDPCCTQLGMAACGLLGIDCTVPSIGECALFEIDDLGVFFLDSALDWNHPRRAKLVIKDATLTGLLDAVGKLVPASCNLDIDHVLEGSTGIDGLTTTPTPAALSRLVFFGADSTKYGNSLPDSDPLKATKNASLNTFLSNSLDPVGTASCPTDALGVNVCANFSDTLRGEGQNTFFISETPWLAQHGSSCTGNDCALPSSGFFEGMRPALTVFANYAYDPNPGEVCAHLPNDTRCAGEQLFVDLVTILDRHWATASSGISRYEELLAWIFSQSDLFGTMADLGQTMRDQQFTSPRVQPGTTRTGIELTNDLVSFLFDPNLAAQNKLTDRKGTAAGTRNDGTPKPQVTPYDLFVAALRGMDARFDGMGTAGAAKKATWRSARSGLIDQFLLGQNNSWQNPAISKVLPVFGQLIREQVNANCPDRETTGQCDWARNQLWQKLSTVMSGPLFSAINDLQESLRGDDQARAELESLLSYLLQLATDPDTLTSTLTSFADLLQVLQGDAELAPVLNAAAESADPGMISTLKNGTVSTTTNPKPGIGDSTVKLMKVLLDDHDGDPDAESLTIDRYHVMDTVLKNIVTSPAPGKPTPLEVVIDTLSEVQRIDSSSEGTLDANDYKAVFGGVESFLNDKYRGLEQFYTIVRHRND